MIVETMNYEEIAREYDKIHDSIFPRSKERIDCQGMRRYLLKHKNEENVWFKQLDYKLDHNTTFCVLPFTPGWKAFQRYGCHPYVKVYLIYLTSKGYMLLVRGGEKDDEYAFFTSHLFDRYRERELRDLSRGRLSRSFLNIMEIFAAFLFLLKNIPTINWVLLVKE